MDCEIHILISIGILPLVAVVGGFFSAVTRGVMCTMASNCSKRSFFCAWGGPSLSEAYSTLWSHRKTHQREMLCYKSLLKMLKSQQLHGARASVRNHACN